MNPTTTTPTEDKKRPPSSQKDGGEESTHTSSSTSTTPTAPSRVVHLRNVGPDVAQQDLYVLASSFGTLDNVLLLRSKNQALMQFTDLQAAINFIQYYTTVSQAQIRGRNVYPQYSSHQMLSSSSPSSQRAPSSSTTQPVLPLPSSSSASGILSIESPPSRILLVTISNVLYTINVDVLHQVFGPHGVVEKIVIFQKTKGLQALVQYQNVQQATLAKDLLNGQNIYTNGSCQLQIQFSNLPSELNVAQNTDKTRDFTNPSLPTHSHAHRVHDGGPSRVSPHFHHDPYAVHGGGYGVMGGGTAGVSSAPQNSVLLISNLNEERTSCPILFNLFSNYGNVVRIKVLHNKPDHALVQMGDYFQASTALHYLKGLVLFGKQIDINYSKHNYISATTQDPNDPNCQCQDYSQSPYNRFNKKYLPGKDAYKHICAPGTLLHISNLGPSADQTSLNDLFSPYGQITGFKLFEINGKKQALVQFNSVAAAAEALVSLHNAEVEGRSMKLSFSKNKL